MADITGTLLKIVLNYRDKNAIGAGTDHPLPAGAVPLLQTPLSAQFNQFWNGTVDQNFKTRRDRAIDQVVDILKAQGASSISGGFPTTGSLNAAVGEPASFSFNAGDVRGNLFLEYTLPGVSFTFNNGPARLPVWKLSFDAALQFLINVPDLPGPLTVVGQSVVSNAKISPDNFAASIANEVGEFLNNLVNDVLSHPAQTLFEAAEQKIDQTTGLPVGFLSTALGQLTPMFDLAVRQGLVHLRAVIDPTGLVFRLTHPIDPAPDVVDSTALPTFHGQILATSRSQIKAGGQLIAMGSSFTPSHAAALHLEWTDTTSGSTTETDIQWTPENAPTQSINLTRQPPNSASSFTLTGLSPNSTFQVRIRDCDALTCTDWSAPLTATTATSDKVDLTLESATESLLLGHTLLSINGAFSMLVTIPAATAPGPYELRATVGNEVAVALISVIGLNQVAQPLLTVITTDNGEASNTQRAGVFEQENVSVRGEDFSPGLVQLDTETGTQLGTAIAQSDGGFTTTFLWPTGVVGNHQINASQIVGGIMSPQANAAVFVQELPR